MNTPETFESIEQYIAGFPEPVQERLRALRKLIREAAPEAVEAISYQITTFKMEGNLIYFAAFKNHINVYPTPDGIKAFEEDLCTYKNVKGSVQFPTASRFRSTLSGASCRTGCKDAG